jgi:hypothetical protein
MADSGFNWEVNWTVLDAAIVLTTAGTITDTSAAIDCDGKAAIMISFDTDYSNHVKATGGLGISILREIAAAVFETVDSAAVPFEMVFAQNSTVRKAIALDCSQFHKLAVRQDWDNTTASSNSTTATAYKFATILPAS